MRGVGLFITTLILISTLLIPIFQLIELYSLREEVLRTDVEVRIGMMDIEVLKRVLVSDMLCKLDLHLSRGALYSLFVNPDEIVLPELRSWASSVRVASNFFDEHLELSIDPGIRGKLVFDGGGYPISLNMRVRLRGPRSTISIDETFSVRHTAKIGEVRGKALYYRDLLLTIINEKAAKNESLCFKYEGVEDGVEVYASATGGPLVYRYEVVVRDRGRAAVLDLRLDYGFSASGVIENKSPEQGDGLADRIY